ncbi:hypothetical protein [Paracoccus sp. S1E-3]|uniref:hypothetical protein n=1 Tax=Paracoccus sp. S1E-3 TaxID=2756130 RepID=UPI0015EF2066|nr:hypothetical protein [Paracoccus sp. S1E-3]MBA4491575.1 hypothetical protein [Paracoccus sp. S1E-3]
MDGIEGVSLPSIYDPAPPNDDPRAPPEFDDDGEGDFPPLPHADRRPLIDPSAWRKAQGDCALELARAAMAVGRLDALVAAMGPGMGQGAIARLALSETTELLWTAGTPVPADELARDLAEARAGTDLAALQQGRWAMRRLAGQGDTTDLRSFLGLHRVQSDDAPRDALGLRLQGEDFDAEARGFQERMAGMQDLHPIAQGAFARTAWALTDLSPEGDLLEGAAWSARTMAADCLTLPFAPLGRAGRRVLRRGGPPEARLRDHCVAVTDAATASRQDLLRLQGWAERAARMTAAIKGYDPGKIIAALITHPQALTATIETTAGISRDTAERLLTRMQAMGLVREITGTRRFRIWSALMM